MKRKKINISAISSALSRSEMRKIMAGSDQGGGGGGTGDGCYYCAGGISCKQVDSGMVGQDRCTENQYPDYGCDQSGSSRCVG